MKVAELRAALDGLPDDMEVCVPVDWDGAWVTDVNEVVTESRTTGLAMPEPLTKTVAVLQP